MTQEYTFTYRVGLTTFSLPIQESSFGRAVILYLDHVQPFRNVELLYVLRTADDQTGRIKIPKLKHYQTEG